MSPYGFLVFGGGHDFLDNVLRWNSFNPDRKVSFIEITLGSYPKEERIVNK